MLSMFRSRKFKKLAAGLALAGFLFTGALAGVGYSQARASTTVGVVTIRRIISGSLTFASGTTLKLADGTAAAPSLTFASDTQTGIYKAGTSDLGFAAGGSIKADLSGSAFNLASGILVNIPFNSIATTPTNALVLQNTTAATGGVTVQMSPNLALSGTAWNSVGSASEVQTWTMNVLPATVAGTTKSNLQWNVQIAGGGVTTPMTLSSAGTLSTSNFAASATGAFSFGNLGLIKGPADGKFNFLKNDGTTGTEVDTSTAGTAWWKTTADADTAILKANVVNATGGVQINGGAASGNVLTGNGTNFVSLAPVATNGLQPGDATARSSSGAFVMMGLGSTCTVTPTTSGKVVFFINGDLVNNTTATTVTIKMAQGTGTAPLNNASATGTIITKGKVIDGLTTDLTSAFHLEQSITGLTLNTAYWFDIELQTSSTNTGQPTNLDCGAYEIP